MSLRVPARLAGSLLAALWLLILSVLPASAHVTIVDGASVPAGGSAVIYFRLPHGCDGQPVNALVVQLPDGIVGAKPEHVAGWTVTTEMVPANYELYGTQYTERVGTIRWEGGPLADSEFLDFGVRATFQLEPGEYPIPVVQECGSVSVAWIEVPAAGQSEDDLEHPAPMITVVAAEGGDDHHGGGSTSTGDSAMVEEARAGVETAKADIAKLTTDLAAANARIAELEAESTSSGLDPALILGLVALVAGIGGLAVGAVALRRRA